MTTNKLTVTDASFYYPDKNIAVDGISFTVADGETVGILGMNGAGKSTLLLMLVGILMPSGGTVAVGDAVLNNRTVQDIRRKIGLVFQNPDDQLFMNTIYDDIAFGLRNSGMANDEVDKRVKTALSEAGIPHLATRAPYKCSGGEKKSAAIACILAMRPDILLLDEPTSGLDPRARRGMIELLRGFKHTKLIAGHDIDMIEKLCDRVMILNEGKLAAVGKTADILSDILLMERYGLA